MTGNINYLVRFCQELKRRKAAGVMVVYAATAFILLQLFNLFLPKEIFAQTEPFEGIRDKTPGVYAITGARIVQSPGQVIDRGTVVIRKDVIESVGAGITPPPDAHVIKYSGKTIYPGLIEMYLPAGGPAGDKGPSPSSASNPGHWNGHVRPERDILSGFRVDSTKWSKLRSAGFTTAVVLPDKGIFQGSAAVITLGSGEFKYQILKPEAAQSLAFQYGEGLSYPSSLMGCIALIRQTFLDARWYNQAIETYAANSDQPKPETNYALRTLSKHIKQNTPLYFSVNNRHEMLRAQSIGEESGIPYWIRGSGDEYWKINELQNTDPALVIPVDFPEAPPVEDVEDAIDVSLSDLRNWRYAPENPARLARAGIPFAITGDGHSDAEQFYAHLREAIRSGLTKEEALAALTTKPAAFLGLGDRLGTIEEGKIANLVVTTGDIFAGQTAIRDVWIQGERHEVSPEPPLELRGSWDLTFTPTDTTAIEGRLLVQGTFPEHTARFSADTVTIAVPKVSLAKRRLTFHLDGGSLGMPGVLRFTGVAGDSVLAGTVVLPDGAHIPWSAAADSLYYASGQEPGTLGSEQETITLEPLPPPAPFGKNQPPVQPDLLLIRNATIWTSGPEGRLRQADLLIEEGKIKAVGKNLKAPGNAETIDATGKHLTPGLIDAHSHTGIQGGVNEMRQAVTADVRIRDILDPEDVAFYRELAGGLTVSHELHGSANPIGGQNTIVKLRWGEPLEDMIFTAAPSTIKFALGENVKQSNWGEQATNRYPQTRMGVEQIIRDRFKAALEYQEAWDCYQDQAEPRQVPPRRDLKLEVLAEILRGDRIIHCHAYRQDELLMFMRVAEEFGITVGTFQHVLEGYKVADIIQKHGAHASTFSDWWAFKFEVYDAIPFNGALMQNVGVLVSFNSDSDKLSRFMHMEAAKAMKYGGLSAEEALKLITLNPARQLHIDERVGSIEPGKDADFVIWSDSPLSAYTRCEQTWIEGRKYFDRTADLKKREAIDRERNRLVQRILTGENDQNGNQK